MSKPVVIISGASSGIGMACAKKFQKEGYALSLTGRDESKLEELKAELGEEVIITVADLTKSDSPSRIIENTIDKFGKIDALVNSAGIIASGNLEETKFEDWKYMFNLNVDAVFLIMQKALPYLEKSQLKSIVNVSSVVGIRQFPGVLSYSVSKAAVDQLTKVSALELAPKGIRVNAINPGVIVSNLHRSGGMEEEKYANFLEHSKTTHPLGRVGETTEAAELIYFLISDKSGFITGQTIALDGGRSLTCFR
jgi:NAD(P)-dependent dehydrogenase (short-subunit alcohol dehydrogenase family)